MFNKKADVDRHVRSSLARLTNENEVRKKKINFIYFLFIVYFNVVFLFKNAFISIIN